MDAQGGIRGELAKSVYQQEKITATQKGAIFEGIFLKLSDFFAKILSRMNELRIPLMTEKLRSNRALEDPANTLKGVSIIDVGCGGGLLSEVRLFHQS